MGCFLIPRKNLIGQLSAIFREKENEVKINLKDEDAESTPPQSESKDSESTGSESKDSESTYSESKDSESKDSESKESESKDSESTGSESKDSESTYRESKDSESKDSASKDSESEDNGSEDTGLTSSGKDSDISQITLSLYQCQYLERNTCFQKSLTRVLKEAGFTTSWHIDQQGKQGYIEFKSTAKPISEAIQLVQNAVTDFEVKIGKDVVYMMPDIHIRDIKFEPEEIMVSVDIEKERIVFTGPRESVEAIAGRLDDAAYAVMTDYQGSNSPFRVYLADRQSVKVSEECFRYICRFKLEEIASVNGVDSPIYVTGSEVKGCFNIDIEGPIDDIQRAVALIGETVLVTKTSQFCLDSKSGSEVDPNVTSSIEEKYGCVMEYQPPELFRKQPKQETFKETSIELKFAEIQTIQADVMVNTTSKKLDISSGWGVSAAINKAGGSGIQQELRKRYPMGIEHDEIAVSGPGKLKNCKAIYHIAVPPYSKDDSSYRKLVLLMKNCLHAASGAGHTSIAFPAMGSGAMQYPPDSTVKLMYQTVLRYLETSPSTSLEQVMFVIYPSANIYLRQLFLMENLSSSLKTKVQTSVQSMYEDLRVLELHPPCFEACLPVNKSYLQILCSDVRPVLDISQCVVILWSGKRLEEKENMVLRSIDPFFKITFTLDTELLKSMCVLDRTTLPDRVLIHSLCTQDDDTHTTEALDRALRIAKKEHIQTLTIPVLEDGTKLGAPHSAAPLIMDAVRRLNCPQMAVSVTVHDRKSFQEFVVMAMDCNGRHIKVSPSVSGIVDCVWRQETSASVPGDSMLLVTSDSKDSHLDAAREFAQRCNMDIAYMP